MMHYADYAMLRSKIWWENFKEDFRSDERGVSGMVVAVILLLISILLAATFWSKISGMVEGWWGQIDGKQSGIGN